MGRLTRRTVALGALGSLGLAGMARGSTSAAADPLKGSRLYRDVRTYADLGDHRTGTAGDHATTDWLINALAPSGYAAKAQTFDYPVFALNRAELRVGGRSLSGFPIWTPKATPPGGIAGPLSLDGGVGTVMLVRLPYNPGASLRIPAYQIPIDKALATGAAAVVAVTENPLGELMALNAPAMGPAWSQPVLSVAGREAEILRAAVGQPVSVHLVGTTTTGTASNVVATRRRPGQAVVLSTPKSGWFRCAGERGSGLAIWLGLARWLAAETDHNLVLLATSGHEFDGYGGRRALETFAPTPAETKLWLHLGANVAAYGFDQIEGRLVRQSVPVAQRGVACSSGLIALATQAFAGQPGYGKPTDIDRDRPPGEVVLYQKMGYSPLIGLVGAHPLHHTPRDLADVTAPALLEPVARALKSMLREL